VVDVTSSRKALVVSGERAEEICQGSDARLQRRRFPVGGARGITSRRRDRYGAARQGCDRAELLWRLPAPWLDDAARG
jgi:hypothetical protein